MKKKLLSKAAVLTMSAALMMPSTVLAAPNTTAPIEMSVTQDGRTHKVFVFGTALALAYTDGSIEISNMGSVGRVDVMIDGNLTKNVSSIDIPAGQKTKLVLDEGSVLVKNVSAEAGEAVKKQINASYAAGASSVDLSSLAGVAAYKINANGALENTAGNVVSANAIGMSVTSVDTAAAAFTAEITEITQRAAQAASDTKASVPTVSEAPKTKKSDSSDSGSKNSSEAKKTGDEQTDDEGGGSEGGGSEGGTQQE